MRGKKNKTRERSEAELQYEKIAHTQVEEELWKSEGRFKALVDNLPQKVFIKDIN